MAFAALAREYCQCSNAQSEAAHNLPYGHPIRESLRTRVEEAKAAIEDFVWQQTGGRFKVYAKGGFDRDLVILRTAPEAFKGSISWLIVELTKPEIFCIPWCDNGEQPEIRIWPIDDTRDDASAAQQLRQSYDGDLDHILALFYPVEAQDE
jgi:hypothetical protein